MVQWCVQNPANTKEFRLRTCPLIYLLRARYIRKVHLEFDPFMKTSATTLLSRLRNKKMVVAMPKLELSKRLLVHDATAHEMVERKSTATFTFVDGSTYISDLGSMKVDQILAVIEMENGRLSAEATKRGKPW